MEALITKEYIDKALAFYGITDKEYAVKCHRCVEEIQKNEHCRRKINCLYNLIFVNSEEREEIKIIGENKNPSELFGNMENPFITNVFLLSGYSIHKRNIEKYALDEKQTEIHKKRVKDALLYDINVRGYKGIRVFEMMLGTLFVNMKIIEVGRLQYVLTESGPIKESKSKSCIKIRIPRGERLAEEDVKKSISDSKAEILKYFKLSPQDYYCFCESWLLSPIINKNIDKSSNIAKFYTLFDIIGEKDGLKAVLDFVFGTEECVDYTKLEEKTSLQRKLKEIILNGEKLTVGIGILKN